MASQPAARSSIDSALSTIVSPTASQLDLTTQSYPPRVGARPQNVRRGSTASSIISLNSSIGTGADWRTSRDYVVASGGSSTAISTLLETPGSRTSTAARPKPGEIPPVTLSQIPKIKPSAFAPYLSISKEYEKYRRARNLGMEEHIRLSNTNQQSGGQSSTPSLAESTAEGEALDGSPPKKIPRARRGSVAVTPLSTVPAVYFDGNFHLENPRTFDVVSERSDVIRPSAPKDGATGSSSTSTNSQRKALATNAILQEKLSWYMDTVEVHLISSISTASSSFFAALGDLRELHSEAAGSVQKIQALRKELVRLDEEQAVKGLEIVRLRRRRDNVGKLEKSVKQIKRVLEGVNAVEKSLENNEIEGALDLVEETERLLSGEGEGLIDLRPVKVLGAVEADLNHLRYRIGKAFEARFVECLLTDLRHHVGKVPSIETLRRFAQSFQRDQYQRFVSSKQANSLQPPPRSSSLPPEYLQLSPTLRSLLMKHLNGLQRAKHVNNAVQAYRDSVIKEAKSLIRRNLPSDDDNESVMSGMTYSSRSGGIRTSQDKSMQLARSLRSLGPADAEDLLVRIYTGISELVRRLGTQQKLLLDVTMQMGETGVGGMLSPRLEQNGFATDTNGASQSSPASGEAVISMDISDLISSAVEIAQSQIVKIVKVRSEQVTHYPSEWFLRYFTLNKLFAQECEAVSVRVGSGLQNAVGVQIKDFVVNWQNDRIDGLMEALEKDRWAAKEVESERQEGVERIMESATRDPERWIRVSRLWEIRGEEVVGNGVNGTANGDENGDASEKKMHAVVDDQKFILSESALMVLKDVEVYEQLICLIPGMGGEIANGMLGLLKAFNSLTCQLILGAGATKSGALKSITTKHLAMASQGLSIIVALIPYLRECVRRHTGTAAATTMAEFDKVKRIYQDHQSEINSKLISIMGERARVHVQNLKRMDWERTWTEQGGEPTRYYIEILCKETTVLHKVLSKHLPPETLMGIMSPVFADYRHRLVEGYTEVRLVSEEAKQRMIKDAETFHQRLGHLEGCGNSGEIILEAVRNKVVMPRISGTMNSSISAGSSRPSSVPPTPAPPSQANGDINGNGIKVNGNGI